MYYFSTIIENSFEDAIDKVTAVDPKASMAAVENDEPAGIAEEIRRKLKNVIESL